ncbi:Clp protease N-terminal domain-containing protein [Embleya hyalina]|uniref:Peptidase n=1 Tax=Embleya hyalina TaxID=516124 RepID=A0A401YXP3_9ACTN|nr:Clp protease N-terminal domain-containing protein [Embleya hyalina]GCD99320.1 peptidase [Embleya hyalina]
MFERFTGDARAVVRGAVEHAQRAEATEVGEEHMLAALLDGQGTSAAVALATIGFVAHRDEVARALARARRRGGVSPADQAALADLGIDVDEIVARVEQVHGEGALAVAPRRRRVWPFGGRSAPGPFTEGAKRVLERSLREALERGDKHIGDEHILLALTSGPGVVADLLAEYGVTRVSVLRALAPPTAQAG